MNLSAGDRALLCGENGPAAKMAMSIIVRMAEIQGAASLLDISQAHIDSTIYMGEAGLEFAERLASYGAKVTVPTSLNVSGLDECHWREWPVPEDWANKAQRQMRAYQSMGCVPTWTCAPYQTFMAPKFGQQIAWGESNAIVFANSVIGARTERYPDLLDICAAITGRVPAIGLHLTDNRAGELLIRLHRVPVEVQQDDSFYPVLGILIGRLAGNRIPVIAGLEARPTQGAGSLRRILGSRSAVSYRRRNARSADSGSSLPGSHAVGSSRPHHGSASSHSQRIDHHSRGPSGHGRTRQPALFTG